jgi:hypothetical protein
MTEDEPKPRLDRIHPVVGFVGGILGGYGVGRAVYTDAGLVGPVGILILMTLLVVAGEVEYYRTR